MASLNTSSIYLFIYLFNSFFHSFILFLYLFIKNCLFILQGLNFYEDVGVKADIVFNSIKERYKKIFPTHMETSGNRQPDQFSLMVKTLDINWFKPVLLLTVPPFK